MKRSDSWIEIVAYDPERDSSFNIATGEPFFDAWARQLNQLVKDPDIQVALARKRSAPDHFLGYAVVRSHIYEGDEQTHRTLWLEYLAVDVDHRGQGVGAHLLIWAMEHLVRSDAEALNLFSYNADSLNFYRGFGLTLLAPDGWMGISAQDAARVLAVIKG